MGTLARLGLGDPSDIQIRIAQVMTCSHKKLKTGYVLNTDRSFKKVFISDPLGVEWTCIVEFCSTIKALELCLHIM